MPTFLQQQFGSETYTYEEFAEAIGGMFAQAFGEGVTELVLEPGVGVVGDAMFYACRVESIKQSHGRGFATTSGSLGHLKILPNEINQPLEVYPAPPAAVKRSVVSESIYAASFFGVACWISSSRSGLRATV